MRGGEEGRDEARSEGGVGEDVDRLVMSGSGYPLLSVQGGRATAQGIAGVVSHNPKEIPGRSLNSS